MDRKHVQQLYIERFSEKEIAAKNKIWAILCCSFFYKFVRPDHSVVDIGAGYCEFLNNIEAGQKTAVDINPDTKKYAGEGIKVIDDDCRNMKSIPDGSVDIVFSSNFLEHLNDKNDVFLTLKDAHRILKKGGLIILMGPNIRYLYSQYWDFFDHKIPLSDRSVAEILLTLGFSLDKSFGKFLPYTTKTRMPKFGFLIRLYISVPLFYWILGKQFLIIGRKS
jgi:SAM-dependent methyltransferase